MRVLPSLVALALLAAALLAAACEPERLDPQVRLTDRHDDGDDDGDGDDDAGAPPAGDDDAGPAVGESDAGPSAEPDAGPTEEPAGFIGSPCASAGDCAYDGAVCISGGDFEGGTCSQACDLYCPDQDGHPTTFCVADGELPSEAQGLGDGACVSRCDFGAFPGGGCRAGYACVERHRANQPDATQFVCLPEGTDVGLPDCLMELGYLDVDFEPTTMADDSPDGQPSLTCHVEDPVILHPPIHGVELLYYDGAPTPNVRMSCEGAKALVQTIDDVAAEGVTAVRHIGTYNCRVIAGTSTLSRHGYGDAIDLFGFEFANGDYYTLVDDWEHETTSFLTPGGEWLYDSAHRWHGSYLWSIILTPNYNAAHDNHFHVDLTPLEHFIGYDEGRFIGPAPYDD